MTCAFTGLIDFLRPYTLDKQLESWTKKFAYSLLSPSYSPTVISPKRYATRLMNWLSHLFIPFLPPRLDHRKSDIVAYAAKQEGLRKSAGNLKKSKP